MNLKFPIIVERLSKLIEKEKSVLASQYETMTGMKCVSDAQFITYKAQALACITDIVGPEHAYTKALTTASMKEQTSSNTQAIRGILESIKDDLESGYLQTIREIVHAEIFCDFIEMSEHLLEQGYKDPAAVLIGSILEEHLRKLCDKNGLPTHFTDKSGKQKPQKASQLNEELCKAQVYPLTNQKQVTAWLGVRNDAAHGKFGSYQDGDVRTMIAGIVNFLGQYPA
jgi:hypothetical protein